MKKMIIAVACVLTATMFTSCGNTEGCYEVTVKYGETSVSGYFYGTKNDLDTYKEKVKAIYTLIDADATITSKKVSKSKEDCTGGGLKY